MSGPLTGLGTQSLTAGLTSTTGQVNVNTAGVVSSTGARQNLGQNPEPTTIQPQGAALGQSQTATSDAEVRDQILNLAQDIAEQRNQIAQGQDVDRGSIVDVLA